LAIQFGEDQADRGILRPSQVGHVGEMATWQANPIHAHPFGIVLDGGKEPTNGQLENKVA